MSDRVRRMTTSGRDRFSDVGEALRNTIDRAVFAEPELTRAEWRVLMAVIRETVSWSRLFDDIPVGQLANSVGFSKKYTARQLVSLAERRIVFYEPGIGKARSRLGVYREAPGDFHTPVEQKAPEQFHTGVEQDTPNEFDTPGPDGGCGTGCSTPCGTDHGASLPQGVEQDAPDGFHTSTEKVFEELSEKGDSHGRPSPNPWLTALLSAIVRAGAKVEISKALGNDDELDVDPYALRVLQEAMSA